jgi:SAM-dependent methyltransferase
MADRNQISQELRDHYEEVWHAGDAWALETSEFERCRYAHLLGLLHGHRYRRALELGCGSGCFTRLLAGLAERVVALDIAAGAIERARAQTAGVGPGVVDLRVADVMDYDPLAAAPWDLVVLNELIYSLGWLYPFFDVAWLAARLFDATRPGGRLLLTNTYGLPGTSWLRQPWLINTYHDLFTNLGFRREVQEVFRGTKEGVPVEVLVALFEKPRCGTASLTEDDATCQPEAGAGSGAAGDRSQGNG